MANLVLTYDGTKAKRSVCRRIDNRWYIVGDPDVKDSGQCYHLDGKYVRINSGLIAWDHETGGYKRIKSNNLIKGIVGNKGKSPIEGYFSKNIFNNVFLRKATPMEDSDIAESYVTCCINEEVALKLGYVDLGDDYMYSTATSLNREYNSNYQMRLSSRKVGYKTFSTNIYGADGNPIFDISKKYREMYSGNIPANVFDRFLHNKTIGIEYETSHGYIPERDCFKYGLIPVRDGSVSGHEFITVPYDSNRWINTVKEACDIMMTRCGVDKYCSLHVHFGNTRKDKLFQVAFYMLCYHLQSELHEMIPYYKKYDINFLASKSGGPKDHCQWLRSLMLFDNNIFTGDNRILKGELDKEYEKIYTFLNDGYKVDSVDEARKSRKHAKDGRNKWEINNRYYWLNLIPLEFGQGTVEFRLHTATLNPIKVVNWILICNAIISYCENDECIESIVKHKEKVNLTDIIRFVYNDKTPEGDFIVEYLCGYILSRKRYFLEKYLKQDLYGNEFGGDRKFTFNVKRKNLFTYGKTKERKK